MAELVGREDVLLAAAVLFSEKGFHGAGQTELSETTGLTWSKIEATFGSKEGLFYAAIEFSRDVLDGEANDGMRSLLRRARKASLNPKLRIFHKDALLRLVALEDSRKP